MMSLESMEEQARSFCTCVTQSCGGNLIQVIASSYVGGKEITYRLNGHDVSRAAVIRALAGAPPDHHQPYAEMLEGRVSLKISPVEIDHSPAHSNDH
jgi:hypothetical protein